MARPPKKRRWAQDRRSSLVIAGTGVLWLLALWLGEALDLSQRIRGLFDLMALGGFALGLWMTYDAWRARKRRDEEG
ncbi:DUF5337 domain-containing protein [Pseudoroseicyclus aestuarii]|uniref:DUF5337 domain-containing protein n=1 Tax=Pseudoroseicyclus aestuarii TaxID=1795041 RepID=A0A318T1S2_9RHOB|nr:DUF5337 domain-containing protein [Pseudoroseicyclus aestuarii]PYE84144.1 hypothetical protein DFP88_103511 [Pseudoroseicyclus aestuarii]